MQSDLVDRYNSFKIQEKKGIQINNTVNIPDELRQFIKLDTYSLLIKGYAGTGKTTLALSILKMLQIKKNCLFISTQVSPEKLCQFFPWLNKFFGKSVRSSLTEIDEITSNKPYFVDARLDEPSALFERITNLLTDTQSPTIVIDSWDAIGFFMERLDHMNNARVLQTWRERAGAKIIYTSEDSHTTFDYLVDGIVELKQKYHEQRLFREIILSKLRGVRINRPSYIYSLNNSIFRSYKTYDPSNFNFNIILNNSKNSEFSDSNKIKTEITELDKILSGGFSHREIVTLDVDSQVKIHTVLAFLSNIFSNYQSSDNHIILYNIEDSKSFDDFRHQLIVKPMKKNIVVFATDELNDRSRNIKMQSNSIKQLQSFKEMFIKIKKENPKKMILCILDSNIFYRFFELDTMVREIEGLVNFINENSDLVFFIVRDAHKNVRQYLDGISDVHLKILEINDTLLFQSQNPWSRLYAIAANQNGAHQEMRLEPVV